AEAMLRLSGLLYEHRPTDSRDPLMDSHVLLNNKQLCAHGKLSSLDGVRLYHGTRAARMLYQAQVRAELSTSLGVQWGEATNGCAEIIGLDDAEMLDAFSTRRREIDAWREANGIGSDEGR